MLNTKLKIHNTSTVACFKTVLLSILHIKILYYNEYLHILPCLKFFDMLVCWLRRYRNEVYKHIEIKCAIQS